MGHICNSMTSEDHKVGNYEILMNHDFLNHKLMVNY
jgi:hypothetical protein